MNKRSGFTLVEVITVIGIIAILSAIAIPNFIRYRNNQQVIRAAREIYSALQLAKMTAIKDNTSVNVLFTPGTGSNGTYRVFEDVNGDNVFNTGDIDISNGSMPPGVNMQSAAFAGGTTSTRFTPIGLTTGRNGTVTVANGHQTAKIIVNIVGGIRVE